MRRLAAFVALCLAVSLAAAQDADSLKPAKTLVAQARAQAQRQGKSVFVVFHAKWCGYCKLMDGMLASPGVKEVWDKHVVTVHLVVMESEDHKADETPGGMEMLKQLGGEGQGIPFSAFIDAVSGKTLATSDRMDDQGAKKGNIGHPVTPEEQAWWDTMLRKGTKMSEADRAVFARYLKDQKVGG